MSIKKENVDRFIQIAAGGKKLTGDIKRMKEIEPLDIFHHTLEEGNTIVPIRKEQSEEELYSNFQKELNDLKNKYSPFLKKYSINIQKDEIELRDFDYRKETKEDEKDFVGVLNGFGNWEKVKTPHYIGETGKWSAYYRTTIDIDSIDINKEYILSFESVDYDANIYLNNRMVIAHTGFFAPFEVDVTEYLKEGKNVLLIVVKNDITTSGISIDGDTHYGRKIYAQTNIGYDEPNLGWHHCPAGAGIIGRIHLISSNKQRVIDCFVKPNIDNSEVTIQTAINSYSLKPTKIKVTYLIEGRNFNYKNILIEKDLISFQYGGNHFTETIKLDNCKLWTLESPYLYDVLITLLDENNEIIDRYQTHFGMRKFAMDLKSKPLKGAYYFNNERIMLRGTNEMGHLTRAVMEDNDEQLINDILTAKIANLNYYRITQRPTLKKVYDYFDMLGMLCQTDFPIFSYITQSSLEDSYKQIDEMERLTRNHPSIVVETFCNEALDKTAWGKEQYVLSRTEMEQFFDIAKDIILILNPDRVIKYNEGDYAPLKKTYGISDFHCYTYWYISHGLPSGKLRKGYLPPIRKDYMCGCGEFGVDGLDRYELMKKYAPKEWLPENENDSWCPKPIAKSQCFALHGDFFPEENDIRGWINASRAFQKTAIKEYVHLLRLRSDYLESTAVHLLIDAWPMGWTKTLVDVDRIPKPAFYAFKEANIPLRVSLRRDKFVIYKKDNAIVEVYAYNDYPVDKEVEANVSVYYGDKIQNFSIKGVAKACSSTYLGDVIVKSQDNYVGEVKVVSEMNDTYDEISIKIKHNIKKAKSTPVIHSNKLIDINKISKGDINKNRIFVDNKYYEKHKEQLEKMAFDGATVVLFTDEPITVLNDDVLFKTHTLEEEVRANNLIYPSSESEYTKEFDVLDFQNFYNEEKDYQDLTAWFKFYHDDMKEILYTLEDSADPKYALHKKHKLIMSELKHGRGKIIVSTLSCLKGCIGRNPILDKLFINLINM